MKLSTVLVETKNNIRARICFKTNTKAKTLSLLNLQLLDSRDHDLGLKDYLFAPARLSPPSTIPAVLMDIKGTIPTVHQSLRLLVEIPGVGLGLIVICSPLMIYRALKNWHPSSYAYSKRKQTESWCKETKPTDEQSALGTYTAIFLVD